MTYDKYRKRFMKVMLRHGMSYHLNEVLVPYMEKVPGYNIDTFEKQYRDAQIIQKMFLIFMKKNNQKYKLWRENGQYNNHNLFLMAIGLARE